MKFVGALSVRYRGVELEQDQDIIHALQDIETWWHQYLRDIKRAIQCQPTAPLLTFIRNRLALPAPFPNHCLGLDLTKSPS